ncbi:MATE family efflux transporter [Altererythrobacter aurantiacus]|uniref:MATE family efflux transporter n=1 Tax=Parapontixanthobacter aurantiacus TaxID=1463599 RepID=A0A844ZB50_9SPHN|nr:MATE family efflux transporter [Parapontixanthobacter aurantiacus]MXO84522.1 MATE family efflux transporter [Parapontixanthobacter aurantiacus]
MSENAKLTRGSIVGHLVTQTAPMVLGVAAIMSIGLVDAYFIGQLGAAELAAISFIFPISVALTSLGVGVMVGINSVIARALGEGNDERAHERANVGIVFAVMLGAAMSLLLFALLDPLFGLMQADEETLPLIRTYMQPFALGFPLLMAIMGLNGVLRGQGEAKKTSIVSLSYAIANWILDPILITGALGFEGLGIVGAAYATLAGWAVGIATGYILLRRTPLPPQFRKLGGADIGSSIAAITRVAGPASFSNAINPIGLSVLTALVAVEGQSAVAGFGAAGRLQSFAVVPLLALSGAIGGIVGQNWGSGKLDRANNAFLYASGFCIAYGLSIALVLVFAAEWFAGLFTDSEAVVAQFTAYLGIAAWGYAGYGLLIVSNGALNAIDRAGWALAQSFARVFLVMLPVAWLLRASWGAEAIYAGELAANLAGGALALAMTWWLLRHHGQMRPSAT